MKPTFIDLFAGIGGMRLAFEGIRRKGSRPGFSGAGCKCVFTSEWNEHSQRTYRANFGGEIAGDIRAVDPEKVPDHDILVAGFPCQPFSLAGVSKKNSLGRPHGFDDESQGMLFFNLLDIFKAKRPRAFLLENVKHLMRHDGGRTLETVKEHLKAVGYHMRVMLFDSRLQVPQHRERTYIVGFREKRDFDAFVPPKLDLKERRPKLRDILEPYVGEEYTLTTGTWKCLKRHAEKHRANGNGFGYSIADPDGVARTLSARYYKDGAEILIARGRKNPRRLTPRECARLMGFPEAFDIVVSNAQAYKQFGNSVVAPTVRMIAKKIVRVLEA